MYIIITDTLSHTYALFHSSTHISTDPTLSFTGLETWSRNINNLKIFFRDPRLDLEGIKLDTYVQTLVNRLGKKSV